MGSYLFLDHVDFRLPGLWSLFAASSLVMKSQRHLKYLSQENELLAQHHSYVVPVLLYGLFLLTV